MIGVESTFTWQRLALYVGVGAAEFVLGSRLWRVVG